MLPKAVVSIVVGLMALGVSGCRAVEKVQTRVSMADTSASTTWIECDGREFKWVMGSESLSSPRAREPESPRAQSLSG